MRLSVSSIGSNWVEQINDTGNRADGLSFSILYRIELGGTYETDSLANWQGTFSILYRIELGGTYKAAWVSACNYELSVSSIGSNWVEQVRQVLKIVGMVLSVSSIGSNWVEQKRRAAGRTRPDRNFQYPLSDRIGWNRPSTICLGLAGRAFSILYRIELGGTGELNHSASGRLELSVSSIGSNWVELACRLTKLL